MSSKRQRKTKASVAKKKKKNVKLFFLSLIVIISAAFLVFFFVSLFDYIYPPITGEETAAQKREKQERLLYFSDGNERFLVSEIRYVTKRKKIEDQAFEIVKALLDGSKQGNVNTLPDATSCTNVTVIDGTASVSFDNNLIERHPGGTTSEIATLYSVTTSLCKNIPQIKRVKILVNGKEIETIKGHVDTRNPFTINNDLLAQRSP
ncbi:MAG: GerMN domain-containing protein [Deltaproteobacteria bacterium]|nr:GerMN domain-containing protein [Deltaproteobacteria bacterium]MBN2687043.1 GerMN domain-containing protein [Deltaproteobacteria bacterium]